MKTNPDAYTFFQGLEAYLNAKLPSPGYMRDEIPRIVADSRTNEEAHKGFPEGAFLNHYVTPGIHEYLVSEEGLSADAACKALLSESFRKLQDISCASPSRLNAHPFQKSVGSKASDIMKAWKGEGRGKAVSRSAPDIALRPPAPHSVIFEGKYFQSGGKQAAENELVKDLYQAFFYLGLSKIEETQTHPAWNYDYACLLAYDCSDNSTLKGAWESLANEVKTAFWEGANIYVMILTGSD